MLEKCISIFWVPLLPKGCFSSMHETFSSNDVDLICLSYNKDIYICICIRFRFLLCQTNMNYIVFIYQTT